MQLTSEQISGDVANVQYVLKILRFSGHGNAPSTYIQAGLHAGELPGVAAIDALVPLLRKADDEGRIRGNITIVPHANPIGGSQFHFGEHQGRFSLGTRSNFNREFPDVEAGSTRLPPISQTAMADARLRYRLMDIALGHDIVLDLHCDDEAIPYLYVPSTMWPGMKDCARDLGMQAVVTWSGSSGLSFDDAMYRAVATNSTSKVVATVEYRGMCDVDATLAQADAEGIYRYLVRRGVVSDKSIVFESDFSGPVGTMEAIETIYAPVAGTVLYNVSLGSTVERGERVATIIFDPGATESRVEILAPQAGLVMTRRSTRAARTGEPLMKILSGTPSARPRNVPFED